MSKVTCARAFQFLNYKLNDDKNPIIHIGAIIQLVKLAERLQHDETIEVLDDNPHDDVHLASLGYTEFKQNQLELGDIISATSANPDVVESFIRKHLGDRLNVPNETLAAVGFRTIRPVGTIEKTATIVGKFHHDAENFTELMRYRRMLVDAKCYQQKDTNGEPTGKVALVVPCTNGDSLLLVSNLSKGVSVENISRSMTILEYIRPMYLQPCDSMQVLITVPEAADLSSTYDAKPMIRHIYKTTNYLHAVDNTKNMLVGSRLKIDHVTFGAHFNDHLIQERINNLPDENKFVFNRPFLYAVLDERNMTPHVIGIYGQK